MSARVTTRSLAGRPVLIEGDMVDWFLHDPYAAAEFLRHNRVQVLDDGALAGSPRMLILTRDSVPGLGCAC